MAVVGVAKVVQGGLPRRQRPDRPVRGGGAGARARAANAGHPGPDKANPALAELEMIRQGRLSVSPVRPEEWTAILEMAGG